MVSLHVFVFKAAQDADSGQWFRTRGNEHWEFDEDSLMRRRDMGAEEKTQRLQAEGE